MKSNAAAAQLHSFTRHKLVQLKDQHPKIARDIVQHFSLNPVTARVLAARGFIADQTLKVYLSPSLREGLADPRGLRGLDEAALLIAQIQAAKGSIAIACDFDVDGLSGGSQLSHLLSSVGIPHRVFVPDRFEDGYGLNLKMIEQMVAQRFNLLVTIDYGTTNTKEILAAKKAGLKTIVIDHHHVAHSAPPADVFVNPHQPGCSFEPHSLCASGLVWYLIAALRRSLQGAEKIDPREYLDLATLGTICDMVPLRGVNRVIAQRGLELLGSSTRPGIVALKKVARIKNPVHCSDVSFGIGPRLNAAGRIIHGDLVIELLTTEDSARAHVIAHKLNSLNEERQEKECAVRESVLQKISSYPSLPAGLVIWDQSFHTGVIGIVAQRLVEQFYRPAAVLGADAPGIYKGSVRGIKGFSVVESLKSLSKYLIKFGGHDGAGGFSIQEPALPEFAAAFAAEAERRLRECSPDPRAEADAEVTLSEISIALIEELRSLQPFGIGNPHPQLLLRDLEVKEVRVLKGTHLKAILSDGKRVVAGLMWRITTHPELVVGNRVNVVARPDYSTFNGLTELQLNLQAVDQS